MENEKTFLNFGLVFLVYLKDSPILPGSSKNLKSWWLQKHWHDVTMTISRLILERTESNLETESFQNKRVMWE